MNNCLQCGKQLVCGKKKRQTTFCSIQCQADRKYDQYITRWLDGQEDGMRGSTLLSRHIHRWLLEQRGEQCWECGWNKKHRLDGKCPIEVEHIDGDHTNNRPENLKLLCPNCHSLTDTYKNRNRGRGRPSRRTGGG